MKLTKRKGFNFFRSYYDVYNELDDKNKLLFMEALLDRQFLGIKPDNLTGMAKFAYISQTNSIDSQVKGFEDKTGIILTPTAPPTDGGKHGGNEPPAGQVEEKGEVEEEEKVKVAVPAPLTFEEREKKFMETLVPHLSEYGKEMLRAFFDYWTEKNPSGKKMRFEMQKVFDVKKRLATWKRNDKKSFNGITKKQQHTENLIQGFAERVMQRNAEK